MKKKTQTQTQTPDLNVAQVLQKNLQYYYNAILKVELQCSSIVIYIFYSTFSEISFSSLSLFMFCSLSSFSLSHLLSPLFRPKHHPPPNINITHHNGSFFLVGCNSAASMGFCCCCCDQCLKEEVGMAKVGYRSR